MIVFNNVASGETFTKALERVGLAETLKSKIVRTGPTEVIARVLQGTGNDIGVGASTLILADKRLKLIGVLPGELGNPISYAAAPVLGAKEPEVAKAFIQFLGSPKAKAEFAAAGAN
jgi:molybdate transport system substrate-binding protein